MYIAKTTINNIKKRLIYIIQLFETIIHCYVTTKMDFITCTRTVAHCLKNGLTKCIFDVFRWEVFNCLYQPLSMKGLYYRRPHDIYFNIRQFHPFCHMFPLFTWVIALELRFQGRLKNVIWNQIQWLQFVCTRAWYKNNFNTVLSQKI